MTTSVAEAIASAVQAIAEASKRDPVAQRISAESRALTRYRRHRPRWLRLVREATARLSEADREGDEDGMVAAILDLSALGIDLDQIERARLLAERLASD